MKFKKLDDQNFILYAIKHYDNPQCQNLEEFYDDLSRLIYIKRLIKKYKLTGELKDRLILNHIIIFYNVFGFEAATKILFLKTEKELHDVIKTFLVYLNYIKVDKTYNEWGLDLIKINLDLNVVRKLREI